MKNKYDIIWLESTDSTNEEAKRRIDICDNMSVLSALSQTSGKGQRGNTWSSEVGQNLLFSIIMNDVFRIKACDQFVISELSALAVADLLSMHGIKASIKWPNDIYVGKRKVARTQGKENAFWVILDYGDIVAHVFQTPYRAFYRLEDLWADAERTEYAD